MCAPERCAEAFVMHMCLLYIYIFVSRYVVVISLNNMNNPDAFDKFHHEQPLGTFYSLFVAGNRHAKIIGKHEDCMEILED